MSSDTESEQELHLSQFSANADQGMRKVFHSVLPESEQRPPSALTIYRKWWSIKLTLDSTQNPNLALTLFLYLCPLCHFRITSQNKPVIYRGQTWKKFCCLHSLLSRPNLRLQTLSIKSTCPLIQAKNSSSVILHYIITTCRFMEKLRRDDSLESHAYESSSEGAERGYRWNFPCL